MKCDRAAATVRKSWEFLYLYENDFSGVKSTHIQQTNKIHNKMTVSRGVTAYGQPDRKMFVLFWQLLQCQFRGCQNEGPASVTLCHTLSFFWHEVNESELHFAWSFQWYPTRPYLACPNTYAKFNIWCIWPYLAYLVYLARVSGHSKYGRVRYPSGNLAKCSSDALALCQYNLSVKSYNQLKFWREVPIVITMWNLKLLTKSTDMGRKGHREKQK